MSFPVERERIGGQAHWVARQPAIASRRLVRPVAPARAESRLSGRYDEARRAGFVALGLLMLLLGFVGAFLPLMPTTIFLILAAWFFGRSSPHLEAWMLDHPRFGPVILDWRSHGAIPRRAKWMACTGMACGYALFWGAAGPGFWLAAPVAAFMLASAAYVVTRPERGVERQADD